MKKADAGDIHAMHKLACEYIEGTSVPTNYFMARKYLEQMVNSQERDFEKYEYASLFAVVGELFLKEKNYKTALKYFNASKEYMSSYYDKDDDYLIQLEKELDLERYIQKASVDDKLWFFIAYAKPIKPKKRINAPLSKIKT